MSTSLNDHFRAMARNNAWSNARLNRACAKLTAEEFAAERVSFFPSLRQTLNHILLVDQFYFAALKRAEFLIPENKILFPDAAALAAAQAKMDRELIAFCEGLKDTDLDREVTIDRKDGAIHRETIAAVLAHLFVHQIHHRGQAHAMLSGTQIPPPQLDEFFLASDLPLRETELRELGLERR